MLHDDHLHLRTHTAPPPPHELAPLLKSAREKNIIPGVREHPYLPEMYRIGPYRDFDYAMHVDEIDRFISLFEAERAPLGLEVDYIAGMEQEQARIIADMTRRAEARGVAVNGIIGSVHILPGRVKDVTYPKGGVKHVMWDLDENVFIAHIKDRGPERLLRDYFVAMRELVKMKTYDVLGHMDLIRKFDRKNSSGESVFYSGHEDLYLKLAGGIIELLSETGMGIEINTAGFFKPLGRPYLTQEILDYAVELKVPVTLGSDSHTPGGIGAHFDTALHMLETAGAARPSTLVNRGFVEYDA